MSLFDILKDCEQLSQTESSKIRLLFGAFPASSGTKLCHIIQSIYHLVSSEKLAQILRNKTSKENNEQLVEFGEGIPFFQPEIKQIVEEDGLSSSSDEEGESVLDNFLRINHDQNSKKKEEKTDQSSNNSINQFWLMEECQKHSVSTKGGLNAEDLFSALFEMLSSDRNNEAIQNDLLELLGFDAIELISKILQERYNIVTGILDGGHESVGQGKGKLLLCTN